MILRCREAPNTSRLPVQVNERGDVNVSGMGPMLRIGCGGFIDISQSARRLVFVGTLRSGNSRARPALSLLSCRQADRDASWLGHGACCPANSAVLCAMPQV